MNHARNRKERHPLPMALLANTTATVAVLATLIALLGPLSGAHFNPAVSFIEGLRGGLTPSKTIAYIIVQIAGCCLGALLAHAMFEMPLLLYHVPTVRRSGRSRPGEVFSDDERFAASKLTRASPVPADSIRASPRGPAAKVLADR